MNRVFLLLFLLFLNNTVFSNIAYVTAEKGARLYEKPSVRSEIVHEAAFGDRLEILEITGISGCARLNHRKIRSNWVFVRDKDSREGYILQLFLHTSMMKIPPHALFYYYSCSINGFSISYNEKTNIKERQNDGMEPYSYYENNESMPQIEVNGNPSEYNPDYDHSLDTIKNYIGLEIVNIKDYQRKMVKNRYFVDTTKVQKNVSPDPDRDSFYLYLNQGKDSVLISDYRGEAWVYKTYAGQISYLNKYLVCSQYESPSHTLLDKTTGKGETFTAGLPYISPDGKYVIDFYRTFSYDDDEGCNLTISKLNSKLKMSETVTAYFKAWIPVGLPGSAFWVSNRELIIKVYAVMNVITERLTGETTDSPAKIRYEYIKVTIKEW